MEGAPKSPFNAELAAHYSAPLDALPDDPATDPALDNFPAADATRRTVAPASVVELNLNNIALACEASCRRERNSIGGVSAKADERAKSHDRKTNFTERHHQSFVLPSPPRQRH
jgi:hypothetical protein